MPYKRFPNLTIHYGHFLVNTKWRPLAQHPQTGPRTVEILNAEEKGSDVNFASYLLLDGFENDYEMAVVISNDSDLQLPVRMTRTKLGRQIGVIDPSNKTSFELRKAASWYRTTAPRSLERQPIPRHTLRRPGDFTKPVGW